MSTAAKAPKAVELKSIELCKSYKIVLYSSGSVQLRRTAWPVMGITLNQDVVNSFTTPTFRENITSMLESQTQLRGAKPAKPAQATPQDIQAMIAAAVAQALAAQQA